MKLCGIGCRTAPENPPRPRQRSSLAQGGRNQSLKPSVAVHPGRCAPVEGDETGDPMKTVFVVDDSATMVMSVKSSLEISGFKVETAADGVQAMAKISKGLKPDLMITDINMPRMDGLELIRNFRKVLRFTPILLLTTESQQAKRDEAKKLGATGWLVKPVGGADLLRVIRQVLPGA
jgi:two-component system chemotaxis response regulator CheY